jgi:hypothetical protein
MSQISQSRIRVFTSLFFIAFAGVALQGCGSSSGSSSAPTDLTLAVQQTKLFHFTWPDASGENGYRLMEDPDSSSGYAEVAAIAADATSYDLEVFLPERINARYMLESCVVCDGSDWSPYKSVVNVSSVSTTLAEGVGYFKGSNTDMNDRLGSSVAFSADGSTLAVGAKTEGTDSSGAVYVYKKSGNTWAQTAYLKALNGDNLDYFGRSVALSEDGLLLAVGAYGEDSNGTSETDNSTQYSGAVYLFSNSGGSWAQTDYIKASTPAQGSVFGYSVALSSAGTTLAVGAYNPTGGGAVYLFSNSGSWTEDKIVTASNADTGDYFGYAIALSADGSTLAVGAYLEDDVAKGITSGTYTTVNNGATDSGAVYLFTSGSGWMQQAYIKASNAAAGDYFGRSVSLSQDGSVLAVGANMQGGTGAGAVYLFSNSSGWQQDTWFRATNTGIGDQFGISISLSGDGSVLAVGAHVESSNAIGINGDGTDDSAVVSGAAYLFSNSSGSWAQRAYIKAPNTDAVDYFGIAIALASDGSMLAVGAEQEKSNATGINGDQTDNSASYAGAVYLY